jgi:hypothetical protein
VPEMIKRVKPDNAEGYKKGASDDHKGKKRIENFTGL